MPKLPLAVSTLLVRIAPAIRARGALSRVSLACALLAACGAPASPTSAPVAPRPTPASASAPPAAAPAPPRPTPYGAARLARVELAFDHVTHAYADFGLGGGADDCLLTFDEREEWLLGCATRKALRGFEPTGETWRGQPILWNPESLRLSDELLPYEKIKLAIVATVGGFHRDEGGEDPVLLVQDWDAVHKNHPGFQSSGIEEWLGIFVHESFHARQLAQPRVAALKARWTASPPLARQEELEAFYAANEAFRKAVEQEHALLRAAVAAPKLDAKGARKALGEWLKLYRARRDVFRASLETALPGKDAWLADGFEMFVEGGARYVEARFLMAPPPEMRAALAHEPTYGGFAATLGKPASELPGLSKVGRRYFYSLGMYLCFLLDAADPSWKSRLFESDGLLVAQVERLVPPSAKR